jgi:Xaa-Pro aminopeptidase
MSTREKQVRLLLNDEELEQLRQLAQAHDRSMNSFLRSLIRQAVNKSTLELPAKKVKKQEAAEYV